MQTEPDAPQEGEQSSPTGPPPPTPQREMPRFARPGGLGLIVLLALCPPAPPLFLLWLPLAVVYACALLVMVPGGTLPLRSAIWGAVACGPIGAVVSIVVVARAMSEPNPSEFTGFGYLAVPFTGAGGAAVGALMGAGIGLLAERSRPKLPQGPGPDGAHS
jgi:hypothetical protein